jgi:hypothetical protein
MPYGLIVPVAVAWLTYRYCGLPQPTARSKWIVGGMVAFSMTASSLLWIYLGLVLQLGIAIFILLYMKIVTESK